MTDTTNSGPVLAADGTPLKRSLARALRRQKLRAAALVAPLLIFVLITFLAPIGDMLFRSVENDIVAKTLPKTVAALSTWDPKSGELPDEAVYAALADDMQIAVAAKNHTKLGSRLNYEMTGASSLFRKSGRSVKKWDLATDAPFKEKFIDLHKGWGELPIWQTMKIYSPKYTNGYFLNAVDMKKGLDGVEARPENEKIYWLLFKRTMFMSMVITISCILLAYPVAWILANLPMRTSNLLMILVLLPFWTSLLVRTSAWKVMLVRLSK
jgi:putative spermidine/putrescine transport system permease protein